MEMETRLGSVQQAVASRANQSAKRLHVARSIKRASKSLSQNKEAARRKLELTDEKRHRVGERFACQDAPDMAPH